MKMLVLPNSIGWLNRDILSREDRRTRNETIKIQAPYKKMKHTFKEKNQRFTYLEFKSSTRKLFFYIVVFLISLIKNYMEKEVINTQILIIKDLPNSWSKNAL